MVALTAGRGKQGPGVSERPQIRRAGMITGPGFTRDMRAGEEPGVEEPRPPTPLRRDTSGRS